ncbi:hypothetical protein LUQ84_3411 [Hamiltosporidium tvaerminnensis]|nr:hypothetical protein LUQ84_3411 [Hamiltosporidium tvaerminnensis]
MDLLKRKKSKHRIITFTLHTILLAYLILYCLCYRISLLKKVRIYFFGFVSLISLLKTYLSNPGFIIKNKEKKYDKSVLFLGTNTLINITSEYKMPFCREIVLDGFVFTEMFCIECNIFKNRSISHCNVCDRCVMERDHHCPWIDNCIGAANFKYFIISIYTTTTCLYFTTESTYRMIYSAFIPSFILPLIFIFTLIFSLAFIIFVALSFYYTMLIFCNTTAIQYIKNGFSYSKINPKEFLRFFCTFNTSYIESTPGTKTIPV